MFLVKHSLHGTIADILDNVTTLHLQCNFPGILHIYHHFHWFQQNVSVSPHTTAREKDLHGRYF